MELTIKCVEIKSEDSSEVFDIKVDSKNYIYIISMLERERTRIIDIFKEMKKDGRIRSIRVPVSTKKDKQLKATILELKKLKNLIDNSIQKIKNIYMMKLH